MLHNIGVIFTGNTSSLSSALVSAGRQVETFDRQVHRTGSTASRTGSLVGTTLKAGVLAAGVAMAYSVGKAIQFETTMRNVNSITGASEVGLKRLSASVLDLATKLPQSANTLAEGLYEISSSGFQGAEGLEVLAASGKAASAGLTTTEVAAKAITAILNAYGMAASDAGRVSDVLFQTVNVGVISFDELAGSIGNVIGMTSAAKVGIEDVGSAIATMTLAGIGGAESMTSLNRLTQSLLDPSEELANALGNLGYESGSSALATDGLSVVMEKLRVASQGNIDTLLKWFPEIRATRGALALMANDGENYARVVASMSEATQGEGATQRAFAEQMKATGAQLKILGNQIEVGAIRLGTMMLPAIRGVVGGLADLGNLIGGGLSAALVSAGRLFENLGRLGSALGGILSEIGSVAAPIGRLLAMIGAGAVIGVLTALTEVLAKVAEILAEHPALIQAVATILGGVMVVSATRAATALAGLIRLNLASFFTSMAGPVMVAASNLRYLSSVIGPLRAGIGLLGSIAKSPIAVWGAAGVAAYGLANSMQEAERKAKDLRAELESDIDYTSPDSIRQGVEGIRAELESLESRDGSSGVFDTLAGGAQLFASALPGVEAKMHEVNVGIRELSAAEQENLGIAARLQEKYDVVANRLGVSAGAVERAVQTLEIDPTTTGYAELEESVRGVATAAERGTPAQIELSEAYMIASDAAADATDRADAYKRALDALIGVNVDFVGAQVDAQASILDAKEALKENGATLDITTEKGQNNVSALLDMTGAWSDLAQSFADQGNVDQAVAHLGHLETQLRNVMSEAGIAQPEIDAFLEQLGLVPGNYEALLGVRGAEEASVATDALVDNLTEVDGTQATATVKIIDATGETRATIDSWVTYYSQTDPTAVVMVDGKPAKVSLDEINRVLETYGNTSEEAKALLNAVDPTNKFTSLEELKRSYANFNPSSIVRVRDEATSTITRIRSQLAALATTAVIRIRAAVSAATAGRWGFVAMAQGGIGTPAHIATPNDGTIYKYNEPETGGEAFIPKRGEPNRSKSILDTAASWYNLKVVPMAMGGIGGQAMATLIERNTFAQSLANTPAGAAFLAGIDAKDVAAKVRALQDLADKYYELAEAVGEAQAYEALFVTNNKDDFDYLVNKMQELAAAGRESAEEMRRLAEEQAQFNTRANDIRFLVGAMPLDRYLEILNMRLRQAVLYSEEWYSIWQQIQSLQQAVYDEAVAALDTAQSNLDAALANVNRMLDAQEEAANRQAQAQARMARETAKHNKAIIDAEADFNRRYSELIKARVDDLENWADAGVRVERTWGNSAAALARNIEAQTEMLEEWSAGLEALRAAGLSEEAIDLLGLESGPEALGQVEALMASSAEEIARLNAVVASRQGAANRAASREMETTGSDLAEALQDLAQEHAERLSEMHEDFLARQQDMATELANIGQDSGRSYSEAIAAGMASGIPAIQAAAQALREAMDARDAAQAELDNTPNPSASQGGGQAPLGHHYIDPNGVHYLRLSGPPITWIVADSPQQIGEVTRLYGPPSQHPLIDPRRIVGDIPDYFGMGGIREFDTAQIAPRYFAKGGVFTQPWTGVASFAEVPSARPEIITPEALMRSVFASELRQSGGGVGPLEINVVVDGKIIESVVTSRQQANQRRVTIRKGKATWNNQDSMAGVR